MLNKDDMILGEHSGGKLNIAVDTLAFNMIKGVFILAVTICRMPAICKN